MELLEDKDPYELQTGWSSSNDDLADITYPDIVNYLVNGSSAYTMDQMKAYKSLDAYNQFVCGWVSNVRSQYSQDKCLMIAKSAEKDVLFAHCENIHQNLTVSHEEANNVEFATRKQSKSKAWYRFRTGLNEHYEYENTEVLGIM